MTNPSKIADMQTKLKDLGVPTLAYYADYFLKKLGDVWSVPMGGTMMSIELEEDHHLEILDYYRDMYHLCSLELLRRRKNVFGLEPENVFGRLIKEDAPLPGLKGVFRKKS